MASGLDPSGPTLEQIIAMLGGQPSTAADPMVPRGAIPALPVPESAYQPAAQFPTDVPRGTFMERFGSDYADSPYIGMPAQRGGSGGSTLERALFTAIQTAGHGYGKRVQEEKAKGESDTAALNKFEAQRAAAKNTENRKQAAQAEAARIKAMRDRAKAAVPDPNKVDVVIDGKTKRIPASQRYRELHPVPKSPKLTSGFSPVDKTGMSVADRIEKDARKAWQDKFRVKYWSEKYPDPKDGQFAANVRYQPPPGAVLRDGMTADAMEADPSIRGPRVRRIANRATAFVNALHKSKKADIESLNNMLETWELQTPGVKAAVAKMLHGQ